MRLATAGNTLNPALLVLKARGYQVRVQRSSAHDGEVLLIATREGNEFVAEDPLYLLGLIALWENRGDDWQTRDDEPWPLEEFGLI